MTTKEHHVQPTLVDPALAAGAGLPKFRYWGSQRPPENKSDFFNVAVTPSSAGASVGSTATLRIYGPIDSWGGWWGVSAKDVAEVLDGLDKSVTSVVVRINSPGGEAFEGITILNLLRAHRVTTTAVVDGLAASAASVIATGCDETVMSPGTQLMIHDARTFVYGPPAVMRKVATTLDSLSNSVAGVYSAAAGGTDAQWRAAMVEETWYSAKEAVTAGLATRVAVVPDTGTTETAGDEPDTVVGPGDPIDDRADAAFSNAIENHWDLSIYQYAGRSHAPAPQLPDAHAPGHTEEEGTLVDLTDEHVATLREQVGFPENADASTIVSALVEALNERANDDAPPAEGAQLGPGMIAVPEVAWNEAQHNGRLGAQAAETLRVQERERFLDEHRDRFLPTNRDAYRAQYDANATGTRAFLSGAPVIVPLDEIGHDVVTPDAKADDGWFPQYSTPTKES
ncbi:MAG: hypothetical protein F2667_00240 [Actinobacteria bacterium]|nr:hypothetical protein [Actinomycetota bacterium]